MTAETIICLPCHLAAVGEDGEHDCNGEMLQWTGLAFVPVMCACPRTGDHPERPAEAAPDPNRGEGPARP